MITKMELIPVTENSYPFQSAVTPCRFAEIGYVEDEYFMSGTANIYTETDADHHVKPIFEGAPYTTRLLIRRPADKAKFSGNVVIEILNASAMMDIDRIWINTWKYMTRNGDIYIGVTSKGHVVDTLKRFNPERYAAINWANPLPDREQPTAGQFMFLAQYESGLYWDMQVELAKLLRTDSALNPIRDYGKNWLYLAGWSQSGSYMSRILNSFAYLPENTENGPLFDGYFEAGADSALAPINAYEPSAWDGMIARDGAVPKGGVLLSREPYIAINTECENRGANWIGDVDLPDRKFRTYQIPGTSHDEFYNMEVYYEGQLREDCKNYGCELQFSGSVGEPLDTPYEFIFNAALRNLYLWVREEIPAPHAPKIDTVMPKEGDFDALTLRMPGATVKYENKKDLFGNTTGGIRMACMDYPVGTYQSYSTRADGSLDAMFGTRFPFSEEKLTALYGSLEHYRALVDRHAEETIAKGFLLRADKQEYVDYIVEMAAKAGLQ